MAEGKTIDVPSVKCESCEEADSSKFCTDCNQPLCTKCTQIHARLAPTKHHKPISIEEYRLLTPSTKQQSQGSQCAKHPSKLIEKLCDDCLVVLCTDCEPDHKGHTIHQGSLDVNFLHRLSAQKIPGLLEIIQQLRDFEDGSTEKIKLYKEAEKLVKSWKGQLLDTITKDADNILGKLQDEIKNQEQFQDETSSRVKEYIVIADQQITKMSDSRKISDNNKLLDQLSFCDKDIEDVKLYLEKLKFSRKKQKIEDILPSKDEFVRSVKMVRNLFTKSDCNIHTLATYPYIMAGTRGKQRSLNLRLRKTRETTVISPMDSRLCGTCLKEPRQISVFKKGGGIWQAQIFNNELHETAKYHVTSTNLAIICIALKRHVTIGYNFRSVHLFDERFKKLKTLFDKTYPYNPCGLCSVDENVFIVSEENENNGSTRFRIVYMNGYIASIKILSEVPAKIWDGLMVYQNTGTLTFADTSKSLSTIDTRNLTGTAMRIHETDKVITSICSDGNSILFGDDGGTVHEMEGGTYKGKITEGSGPVTGLLPIYSGIVVLAGNTLQLYQ